MLLEVVSLGGLDEGGEGLGVLGADLGDGGDGRGLLAGDEAETRLVVDADVGDALLAAESLEGQR